MKRNFQNVNNGTNRLVNQLASEKKKTVLAICLISLMAFMWIKVFIKKGPVAADAMLLTEQLGPEKESSASAKVSFVELPVVKGRNDMIVRDFFSSNGWENFIDGKENKFIGTQEVEIVSESGKKEIIKKVAEKLKLEATVMGKNALACINNKVLSVGDIVLINIGADQYVCEVVKIEENAVSIKCGEGQIILKLSPVTKTVNSW
jgi:hypothetical protein